jgi:hypothetical protein
VPAGQPRAYAPSRGAFAGRTFPSKHAYREALARSKGYASSRAQRTKYRPANSRASLDALPRVSQQKRADALEVLAIMRREGKSLSPAIRTFTAQNPSAPISPEAVKKYVRPALTTEGRKIHAKPYDRLMRLMRTPTKAGATEIEVHDSRSAARIARYWNAVGEWLRTGDSRQLRRFVGKHVQSGRIKYPLLTDLELLERLAEFGEFRFESIYEELVAAQV